MNIHLTPREIEVLKLIAAGYVRKEVANKLSISIETVKTHMHHIFLKLNVTTAAGAVGKAMRKGIIS